MDKGEKIWISGDMCVQHCVLDTYFVHNSACCPIGTLSTNLKEVLAFF